MMFKRLRFTSLLLALAAAGVTPTVAQAQGSVAPAGAARRSPAGT